MRPLSADPGWSRGSALGKKSPNHCFCLGLNARTGTNSCNNRKFAALLPGAETAETQNKSNYSIKRNVTHVWAVSESQVLGVIATAATAAVAGAAATAMQLAVAGTNGTYKPTLWLIFLFFRVSEGTLGIFGWSISGVFGRFRTRPGIVFGRWGGKQL